MTQQSDPPRPSHLERQRAILYHMLRVTREQRRCLVEGDLKGIGDTNRLLGSLLDRQDALRRDSAGMHGDADPSLAAEVRSLAQELRDESKANYLLACRGAEFANLSISLLTGAHGAAGSDDPHAASPQTPSHVMDRPA